MKVPKNVSLKTLAVTVLIAVLASGFIFYVLAPTPTTTFWVSPGIYPSATTFTVWVEGSNYFAKNENGEITYSDTNASQLFLDILGDDRDIYVKAGTYFFDSPLTITNEKITFKFENGVDLNFTGSYSPLITIRDTNFVVLDGKLTTIMNDGAGTDRVMLNITNTGSSVFRGLYLHNHNASGGIGVLLHAFAGTGIVWNEFQDLKLWRCETGLLFNSTGSGYINRNRFWNIYAHYSLSYGFRLIGTGAGNNFHACEIAHANIGLSYEMISAGGNHFYGCTFDTCTDIAIDMPHLTHRSLNVIGATVWHTGTSDAINGTFAYGDHFTSIVGDHYSEFSNNATIGNGLTSVTVEYNCWTTPWTILVMPYTDLGGLSLAVTSMNSTHATITASSAVTGDKIIGYKVFNFP